MKSHGSAAALIPPWLVLAALLHAPAAFAAQPVRPHVVVIMTDDQRADTMRVMTKTLALIAAEGVSFDNALVSFPVCSPSRATFLTGQYAHNHKVMANALPLGGHNKLDHRNTLPVWLRDAGYRTAFIGKYLNHYGEDDPLEIPAGWDDWQGLVSNRYYGFTLNANGVLVTSGGGEDEYQTDVFAAKANDVIRRHAANFSGQPLFLLVAPQAPHNGRNSDEIRDDPAFAHLNHSFGPRAMRHLGAFENEPLEKSGTFDERSVEDKPAHVRLLGRIQPETSYGIEAHYRAKLEMLLAVDDLVESVVTALRASGMLDRTLMIFTADNGFFHGEHRIVTGKHLPYDEALRVPLLIRGPGFPAGTVASQLVANVDLAPTIVELTGAVPRRLMDGRSLVRLANNPSSGLKRSILLEAGGTISEDEGDDESESIDYRGVRNDRYQYVEYETGDRELYYLTTDPAQANNRLTDPRFTKALDHMQGLLVSQIGCRGNGCSQGTR